MPDRRSLLKESGPTSACSERNPSRPMTRISPCRPVHRVEIPPPDTIADGLRPNKPGALTFPIVQQNVEAILLASEEEIRHAVEFVQSRMKIVVEPSGAVPPAVVLFRKLPEGIRRAGIVVSGGNV